MPFKSKAQIAAELEAKAAVIPEGDNDVSTGTEKNEKKVYGAAAETAAKRLMYQKELEIDAKDKEIEELKAQLTNKSVVATAPDMTLINQLQAQVDQLSRQVVGTQHGNMLKFRQPVAADLQDEAITFTARSVIYIVASYIDSRGLEQLPPHKLLVFQYAASDIRKDGREEEIKNFSQYTTNLKTEIAFLRNHPFYGITFSENTNEMMSEDVKEIQFKVSAATQLSTASPESIFARAEEFKIPNWRNKSAAELKPVIIQKMAELYKQQAEALQNDIIRRQSLASLVKAEKE